LSVHEEHMQAALEIARRGLAAGEPPIGAVVVLDGVRVARAHNSVISLLDATAHAEIIAIRESCQQLRALQLEGCDLYSTVEPCPMCLAACHYAGIRHVYFGATLADMQAVTGSELMDCSMAGVVVEKTGGVLAEECLQLLHDWIGFSGNGPG
jgi:tRNA(Arg) A34 adenosine deaminase TadA